MLEELLEHVDDRRRAAWLYSLPGAPAVDPFDQLRLNPDVDICGFAFHGRFAARGEYVYSRRYGLSGPKCSAADPRDHCWPTYCCH